MRGRLSIQGAQTVEFAEEQARSMGHQFLGTEHLLLGLLSQPETAAAIVLTGLGVDPGHVSAEIERTIAPGERHLTGPIPFTPLAEHALQRSMQEAEAAGQSEAGAEQLLLGVADERRGLAARILLGLDVSPDQLRAELARVAERPSGQTD